MRVEDFVALRWSGPGRPLIEPPRFSPLIADPSFLFPEESIAGAEGGAPGDRPLIGSWELFAHSAWGIHRYSSPDGIAWRDRGIVVRNAMRPFIRWLPAHSTADGKSGAASRFALYYEAYTSLALPLSALPLKRPWNSRIAFTESMDLINWSESRTVLKPELPWMSDSRLGASVSNPCLVKIGLAGRGRGGFNAEYRENDSTVPAWRLYYSASLAWIPDCGFCEPRYLAASDGPTPAGPFAHRSMPISDPADDTLPGVIGAGSIKVVPMDDGYVGLQNKIYRDPSGRSRSAIFLLRSEDGLSWLPARSEPLLAPAVSGWTSSHVYACDCRFREADGRWYLYFNARDGWRIGQGKERIGRIVGTEQKRICGGSLGGSTPAGRKES